ncbi:unnamed protein product [Paramecium octaurelia]|uniref:C2 domain-containing protein n=1 Tax=Paramecium octaurelia TaxID=43137 RepID=A0A8S1S5X0_PAROT|nr:unnamed protein product [Paramecium octaurelia]
MYQPSDREKIELYISARKLANMDVISDSDPKCKIFVRDINGGERQIGQTEVLKNNLNPDWKTTIQMDFIFEIKQELRFEVWDHDDGTIDKDDLIGVVNTTVGEIMGSRNQVYTGQLKLKNKATGTLLIKGDKLKDDNRFIFWQWEGKKIKNVDGWFGNSDPFLRFYKQSGNDWLFIHETEFCKNNENPHWKPFEISMSRLNAGNTQQQIKVECWDNQTNGKHQYIGETLFTIHQIENELKREFISLSKKGSNHGVLQLKQFSLFTKPSFIDYIKGGEQINLMIAVDFTGSNGDPKFPNSLHYNNPNQMNQYQSALYQVSEILLNYDFDKKIPMYGFGGVPHFPNYTKNQADHCFPLTGSFQQPEVFGLEGIMAQYSGALQNVTLSGPTYFAPIIQYACQTAQQNINQNIYTVLMILTDGEIHDMNQTTQLIIGAAKIPLSIIIIGVGDEQFQQMRTLDGDSGPLKGSSSRDLVQFVPFRDFKQQGELAREVLAELPNQLVTYKQLLGLQPIKAPDIHLSQLG